MIPQVLMLLAALGSSSLEAAAPSSSPSSSPIRVIMLGDSLTEGYGISKEDAYPALLQKRLESNGRMNIEIINAGISGSTTASGESRLKWHLKAKPQVLVLALGANDGLRGVPVTETRRNLSKIIELAQANQMKVLLAGMKLPPNYGAKYTRDFETLFQELSKKYQIPLVPFLLEGVGGVKTLNLPDGVHPNEKGHEKLAETVYPHLIRVMDDTRY